MRGIQGGGGRRLVRVKAELGLGRDARRSAGRLIERGAGSEASSVCASVYLS